MDLAAGDRVRVAAGPCVDFVGVVSGIDPKRSKVKVTVTLFGKGTSIDLDVPQVVKL